MNFYRYAPNTNINTSIVYGPVPQFATVLIEYKHGRFYMDKEPMPVQVFQTTPNENEGNLVLNTLSDDLTTQYYSESIRWFKIKSLVATDESNIIRTNPSTINLNWKTAAIIIGSVVALVGLLAEAVLLILSYSDPGTAAEPIKDRIPQVDQSILSRFDQGSVSDLSVYDLYAYLKNFNPIHKYQYSNEIRKYSEVITNFIENLKKEDFSTKDSFTNKLKNTKIGEITKPEYAKESKKFNAIVQKIETFFKKKNIKNPIIQPSGSRESGIPEDYFENREKTVPELVNYLKSGEIKLTIGNNVFANKLTYLDFFNNIDNLKFQGNGLASELIESVIESVS